MTSCMQPRVRLSTLGCRRAHAPLTDVFEVVELIQGCDEPDKKDSVMRAVADRTVERMSPGRTRSCRSECLKS
jgi:hypothetical protein